MKILKFNETYDEDTISFLKQKVELFAVEDVLLDALEDGEINIHVNIEQLLERIAEYPKHSKTLKKYNL